MSYPHSSPFLPEKFSHWFEQKGWQLYPHQKQIIESWQTGHSVLLVAPTGAGKTLCGFLPSLLDIHDKNRGKATCLSDQASKKQKIHTLYISPLKALAVDIARNLQQPVSEMGLDITVETRTGDTPISKRNRQKHSPPDFLLTTPESLELMLSWQEAVELFADLRCIIIDEIHAVVGSKRGDLLSLSLAALRQLAPNAQTIALSATLAQPETLLGWIGDTDQKKQLIIPDLTKHIDCQVHITAKDDLPWAGHSAFYALETIYHHIQSHETSLIFVNTRAQAELLFQALWHMNELNLKIGIHHGSLDVSQRRKVEAAMARGELDAIVATSSLDLGIDWAEIDLVVQVGAPKGTARLMQRIGRSGHRLDAKSKAIIIPANRFEVFEAFAAKINLEGQLIEALELAEGSLDVLAQHIVGRALAAPFDADKLYEQVITAPPYAELERNMFDKVLDFVSTGGYALDHYRQFHRLVKGVDGLWRVTSKQVATRWKMNVGAIVESSTMKVKIKSGPVLGEIEDYFVQNLTLGDSFIFAGRIVEFRGIKTHTVEVVPSQAKEPKVPAYAGGRLPLSPGLADSVRELLNDPELEHLLPLPVREWLAIQKRRSSLPTKDKLLVETFPRGAKHYMVCYSFAGRNAHQTLGMLLTRRMERIGLSPIGFVATDYAIAVWTLHPVTSPETLLSPDILGDDLEEWMAETTMLKRSFRQVATIAGLIDKNIPGHEKTGRQMTVNSDLIYDVLRQHQPDHLLLLATRKDAARGLTDIKRLSELLNRYQGQITHQALSHISPLSVPLILEVGKEAVSGAGINEMLDELQSSLIQEAMQ